MSVEAMNWAFRQRGLSDGCARLLLALADYADHDGVCWPSRARLAERLEKSVDTVDRRAAELVAAGALCRVPRNRVTGAGGVITLTNAYKLHLRGECDVCRENAAGSGDDPSRENAAGRIGAPAGESTLSRADATGIFAAPPDSAGSRENAAGSGDRAAKMPPAVEVRPGGAAAAAAGGAAYGAAHESVSIEPSIPAAAAWEADADLQARWFQRLTAAAGPGLADPGKDVTGSLHYHAGVFVAWARAGVDLEADAVPVIVAKTKRQRAQPVGSWKVFSGDVLAARDRRMAQLPLPNPHEATHVYRSDNLRPVNAAERELALAGARRASWARVLGKREGA